MKDLEHIEQVKVVKWFELQHKKLRIFAIPNGGMRHIAVASKLKAEGVRSGVPDLFLPVAMGEYHGLFIEMKSAKGNLTEIQSEWVKYLSCNGYNVEVCFSFEQAKEVITNYLNQNSN